MHIVEPPRVGQFCRDRVCVVVGGHVHPGVLGYVSQIVAEGKFSRRAGAAGVFPLRFAGQREPRPLAERFRVVPTHVHDGVLVSVGHDALAAHVAQVQVVCGIYVGFAVVVGPGLHKPAVLAVGDFGLADVERAGDRHLPRGLGRGGRVGIIGAYRERAGGHEYQLNAGFLVNDAVRVPGGARLGTVSSNAAARYLQLVSNRRAAPRNCQQNREQVTVNNEPHFTTSNFSATIPRGATSVVPPMMPPLICSTGVAPCSTVHCVNCSFVASSKPAISATSFFQVNW